MQIDRLLPVDLPLMLPSQWLAQEVAVVLAVGVAVRSCLLRLLVATAVYVVSWLRSVEMKLSKALVSLSPSNPALELTQPRTRRHTINKCLLMMCQPTRSRSK